MGVSGPVRKTGPQDKPGQAYPGTDMAIKVTEVRLDRVSYLPDNRFVPISELIK